MPAYRIYRIGGDGRFSAPDNVDAPDDESAVAAASSRYGVFEVWQGDRLVARLDTTGQPESH